MIFLLMELDSKFESMLFDQKIIGEPISTSVMVLPPLELPSIVSTWPFGAAALSPAMNDLS
jgi:hypothetical protein